MDQITYVIHQSHYNIYLVYKFEPTIMNECKVIHKQTYDKELNSVIFDSISGFTSIYFMMDQITYVIHLLHYNIYLVYKFQPAIMNEYKIIRKQTSDKEIYSVILESISRLTSIYFHDGSNYICDPSTTLLYLPCVQISTYYNERMRSSSQTTSDKDSNFVIFDHFDSNSRLIQFIFMMDQITYVIQQ